MTTTTSELIHPRLRQLLREYFSSFGVLASIHDAFRAEQVERGTPTGLGEMSGARRWLVEEYYAGLDFTQTQDARKFANILAAELDHLRGLDTPDAQATFEKLRQAARRDGLEYEDGRITAPFDQGSTGIIGTLADALNLGHLREHVHRIERAVDTDPSLAVGSAKDLLETCCKTVITARGETWDATADLPKLVKQAQKLLKLLPSDVDEGVKGAGTIQVLLNNLGAVAKGVAELRGLYGTGHGRDGRFRGIQPRHARLAVGSAVTLTTFLIETHLDQQEGAWIEASSASPRR